MKHGSLFSGIGGFELAADWMGWENVFHCEKEPFGQRVLKHYWPESKCYEDVTVTDFRIWRGKLDLLTGGFPCQPYSEAGKRLGKEDDRHLWPHMLRAIREISPRWVVGENVRGLVSWNDGLVFDEVQADLETEGYEVQPFILPACAVNAPHRRDRVWFVAYCNSGGLQGCRNSDKYYQRERTICKDKQQRDKVGGDALGGSRIGTATDSDNARASDSMRTNRERKKENERREGQPQPEFRKICNDATDTNHRFSKQPEEEIPAGWHTFKCSDSADDRTKWGNFPTQPPVCSGDDGLSSELDGITFPKWRNESIKAYGNAIVPQVALQIFRAIQQYETSQDLL